MPSPIFSKSSAHDSRPVSSPLYPHIDAQRLRTHRTISRDARIQARAFASDIMTWNYSFADRLELHLRHDREFISWMARRGINAFSYIRHAHDTRLKIDELAPLLRERGIDAEYGGHVLPLLLPRERFDDRPEFFPAGDDGVRIANGNLCVSNPDALALVSQGALAYTREHPENKMLHVWGADVRGGAWCQCAQMPPTLAAAPVHEGRQQYRHATLRRRQCTASCLPRLSRPIDPHPGLQPHKNVSFRMGAA